MTRPVHVIATFNPEGKIRPLWMKLSLDEDAPCYQIQSCVCTTDYHRFTDVLSYRCEILVNHRRLEVGLQLYLRNRVWSLIMNDSLRKSV